MNSKTLLLMINQAKLQSHCHTAPAVSIRDTPMVAPPIAHTHTDSLIHALRSPKITAQEARQLHHTEIRRILSERGISHPRATTSCADICDWGEGTDAQTSEHIHSRHIETRDAGEMCNFEIVLGDIFVVNDSIACDENEAQELHPADIRRVLFPASQDVETWGDEGCWREIYYRC